MKAHECRASKACRCSAAADEPHDSCQIHGYGDDNKCAVCGRYFRTPASRLRREMQILADVRAEIGGYK